MASSSTGSTSQFRAPPFELGRFDLDRIGREIEWQRLTDAVGHAADMRAATFVVLLGDYGAGKTFLLTKLYETVIESRLGFGNRPVRFLLPEGKRDFLRNAVINTFKRGFDFGIDLIPLLQDADSRRATVESTYEPYVQLLFGLLDPEHSRVALRVLHGGRITRSEAIKANFGDLVSIQTNDHAFDLLIALLIVCRWANRRVFTWLIDELEYIEQLSVSVQGQVFDSLKDVFDRVGNLASRYGEPPFTPLAIVLAATPSFWQKKKSLLLTSAKTSPMVGLAPFFARVPEVNQIEIPFNLSPEEAHRLIENRMSVVREDSEPPTPIVPFTEDYINFVYQQSRGLPRKIIEICDTVLTAALKSGVEMIDRETAAEILREMLITFEAEPLWAE